jgi:hypothetical protein
MSKQTLSKIEGAANLAVALAAAIGAAKAAGLNAEEITKQLETMVEIIATDE